MPYDGEDIPDLLLLGRTDLNRLQLHPRRPPSSAETPPDRFVDTDILRIVDSSLHGILHPLHARPR
jgi:hypothetical protein